ncbi:PIR protein [Plasmodium yoelii]|uniref:PIR protein n=2 Tax=Plasmodium yoelii TaxID=5861 RepID=A0AAF0B7Y9_PLAYO|nr:PIR protein [Plasmodium yoelii]WBY61381.1 PIR protein [Plasmodium yoelii yoelii]VTZ82035.1 PIR protein [Plasmodium yoelii]|eukprot:XP_022811114.1 PIR protein [Plasmodium yoelii]
MDKTLCEQFDTLRKYLPDDSSNSTTSDINKLGNAKNYCSNEESGDTECKTDLDNINAGCLWLLEQLFVKNSKNISTVEYIIIWLSYKLNQKKYDGINNLNDFYKKYIENNRHYTNCKQGGQDCSGSLSSNTGYNNYKEIINKRKSLLNINIKNMSKIYDAFKLLCNMYTELNANSTISEESLGNAKNFVKKYKELNDDSTINGDGSYKQVLSTLSIDYINFKSSCADSDDCNKIPSLTSSETEENGMQSSKNICDDTPSLSIAKKLILALLIFSTISIFLGIFFKCSLFVLRKRAQKEYLREKLKNIKKRMNH